MIIAEILSYIRTSGSIYEGVKRLKHQNSRMYARLEQRTVKDWFEQFTKGVKPSTLKLTAASVQKLKDGFASRTTIGKTRKALLKMNQSWQPWWILFWLQIPC